MTDQLDPGDRADLHIPSIDEDVAMQGECGRVYLPTGDTCTLRQHHTGSCRFLAGGDVPQPPLTPPADA